MLFLSTLPQGERRSDGLYTIEDMTISIHAPARGATPIAEILRSIRGFLSTLPQGERPSCRAIKMASRGISIHAPARGATDIHRALNEPIHISIHAPARGATRPLYGLLPC